MQLIATHLLLLLQAVSISSLSLQQQNEIVLSNHISRNAAQSTEIAQTLRKFILDRYWLGDRPPVKCGVVPKPMYKWYWDCFQEHYLNDILSSASSSSSTLVGNVNAPPTCSNVHTLEDLFCTTGNREACLQNSSLWGPCQNCNVNDEAKALYQQCSSLYGSPFEKEPMPDVESLPSNPNTCSNDANNLGAKVKVFCKLDSDGSNCESTIAQPFFATIDKRNCSTIPMKLNFKFLNVNTENVIVEDTTTIMIDNQSVYKKDGGDLDESTVFGQVIEPASHKVFYSVDYNFDTCSEEPLSVKTDLHVKSTTIPTVYVQCGTEIITAVKHSNSLLPCVENDAIDLVPNTKLWECMYENIEYKRPSGSDFFEKFLEETQLNISDCKNGDLKCAAKHVGTLLPALDEKSPINSADAIADMVNGIASEISTKHKISWENECGSSMQGSISWEDWTCFHETVKRINRSTRKRNLVSGADMDIWSTLLTSLSSTCIESTNTFGLDYCDDYHDIPEDAFFDMTEVLDAAEFCGIPEVRQEEVCSFYVPEQNDYSYMVSILEANPEAIAPRCLNEQNIGDMADCTVKSILLPNAPTSTPITSVPTESPTVRVIRTRNDIKLRDASQKSSNAQIFSSLISFLSSLVIICIIFRSYEGATTTFDRMFVGLCGSLVISTFWMMLATAPVPRDTRFFIWNPMGNQHSCNTQGFFLYIGVMTSALYIITMAIYAIGVMKYNKDIAYEGSRLRALFVGAPLLISIILAVIVLSLGAYDESPSFCWVSEKHEAAHHIFSSGMFVIVEIAVIALLVILQLVSRKQTSKLSKYGVDPLVKSNGRSDGDCEDNSLTESEKENIVQSTGKYSIIFLVTFMFPFIQSLMDLAGLDVPSGFRVTMGFIFPLHGLLNFIVFIHSRMVAVRKTTMKSWPSCIWDALTSRGEERSKARSRRTSPQKMKQKSNEDLEEGAYVQHAEIKKLKKWPCLGVHGNVGEDDAEDILEPLQTDSQSSSISPTSIRSVDPNEPLPSIQEDAESMSAYDSQSEVGSTSGVSAIDSNILSKLGVLPGTIGGGHDSLKLHSSILLRSDQSINSLDEGSVVTDVTDDARPLLVSDMASDEV